jgi:DnaJ like chaperone protein
VGLLSWLGLKKGDAYPNLDALLAELRRALPDDESVFLRYIAVVVVLLGKVASADGRITETEEQTVRGLLSHIDRLSPSSIDAVCTLLRGNLPKLSDEELALCYRELKALCDGRERLEVLRLLTEVAAADGALTPAEHTELQHVADELGVPESQLEAVEQEVQEVVEQEQDAQS